MSNERFYDRFLDDLNNPVTVNEEMDKMLRFMPDDVVKVVKDGEKDSKEEDSGESTLPNVSLTSLIAKAKHKNRGSKRAWVKKSEIQSVSDMEDETFKKFWDTKKVAYLRGRHVEFGKDSSGEEIVSLGRRGLVPRNEDFSVDDLMKEIPDERITDDEIAEAAFSVGDPWFIDQQRNLK